MLLGWFQSLDLMKTISREKQFSHLKSEYFVCGLHVKQLDIASGVRLEMKPLALWHSFLCMVEKIFWRIFSFHQTMSVWKGISRFVYLWPEKCSFKFYTSFGLISPPVLWFRRALQHWRPSSRHILCIYGEYYCFIASGYLYGTSTLTCIILLFLWVKSPLEISAQQNNVYEFKVCVSSFFKEKKFCSNFSEKKNWVWHDHDSNPGHSDSSRLPKPLNHIIIISLSVCCWVIVRFQFILCDTLTLNRSELFLSV